MVKQVSVFLENAKGRLFEVSNTLAKNGININGISLADTTDFGILRLIVNDPYETVKVLKEHSLNAILVLRTEEHENACKVLSGGGIELLTEEEFYAI